MTSTAQSLLVHFRVIGVVMSGLVVVNVCVPKRFHWREEMARLSLHRVCGRALCNARLRGSLQEASVVLRIGTFSTRVTAASRCLRLSASMI
jgi:hypothetical protein